MVFFEVFVYLLAYVKAFVSHISAATPVCRVLWTVIALMSDIRYRFFRCIDFGFVWIYQFHYKGSFLKKSGIIWVVDDSRFFHLPFVHGQMSDVPLYLIKTSCAFSEHQRILMKKNIPLAIQQYYSIYGKQGQSENAQELRQERSIISSANARHLHFFIFFLKNMLTNEQIRCILCLYQRKEVPVLYLMM